MVTHPGEGPLANNASKTCQAFQPVLTTIKVAHLCLSRDGTVSMVIEAPGKRDPSRLRPGRGRLRRSGPGMRDAGSPGKARGWHCLAIGGDDDPGSGFVRDRPPARRAGCVAGPGAEGFPIEDELDLVAVAVGFDILVMRAGDLRARRLRSAGLGRATRRQPVALCPCPVAETAHRNAD